MLGDHVGGTDELEPADAAPDVGVGVGREVLADAGLGHGVLALDPVGD